VSGWDFSWSLRSGRSPLVVPPALIPARTSSASPRIGTATRWVVPRGWFAYPATTSVPANSSELPSVVDSSVDHFSGSDGGQIGVSATKMTPGLTLKSWAAGTPKRLQILFGCKPTAAVAGQVAGVAAAVFTIRPSCGGPLRLASTDYAVARGGYGYDIRVVSSASSQAHDHAVFEQTLTTFRFTR